MLKRRFLKFRIRKTQKYKKNCFQVRGRGCRSKIPKHKKKKIAHFILQKRLVHLKVFYFKNNALCDLLRRLSIFFHKLPFNRIFIVRSPNFLAIRGFQTRSKANLVELTTLYQDSVRLAELIES